MQCIQKREQMGHLDAAGELAGACEHTVHGQPGSVLLAIRVPGGWCPARQQTACLRGTKVEW